jgi:hypothetical protein
VTQPASLHLPRPRMRLTGPAVALLLMLASWGAIYMAYRLVKAALS